MPDVPTAAESLLVHEAPAGTPGFPPEHEYFFGAALVPTIHNLCDVGAWSLTDDRRIIVSANLTGSDAAIERIRAKHGQPLRSPLPGESEVGKEFTQRHREPDLGGIFRAPALPH